MPHTILRKKKPHTNLPEEIYTPEPKTDLTAVVVSVVLGLIITLAIVDLFFSETVTEVLSNKYEHKI